MSWVEKGVITTVPINALFDGLEQTGEEEVTYTVEDVTVAGNVAFVRISSSFSKLPENSHSAKATWNSVSHF